MEKISIPLLVFLFRTMFVKKQGRPTIWLLRLSVCLKPKFDQLFCISCLNLRGPRSGRTAEIFSSTHVLHPLIIRCLQAWPTDRQTDRQKNIKKAFWAVKLSSGFLLNSCSVQLIWIKIMMMIRLIRIFTWFFLECEKSLSGASKSISDEKKKYGYHKKKTIFWIVIINNRKNKIYLATDFSAFFWEKQIIDNKKSQMS